MTEENREVTENKESSDPPLEIEKIKEGIINQERERVLALMELTEDSKELRKFIEGGIDPAKAAMQILKQLRDTKKKTSEGSFPSANLLGAGLSKAQNTINLAKKLGVI